MYRNCIRLNEFINEIGYKKSIIINDNMISCTYAKNNTELNRYLSYGIEFYGQKLKFTLSADMNYLTDSREENAEIIFANILQDEKEKGRIPSDDYDLFLRNKLYKWFTYAERKQRINLPDAVISDGMLIIHRTSRKPLFGSVYKYYDLFEAFSVDSKLQLKMFLTELRLTDRTKYDKLFL